MVVALEVWLEFYENPDCGLSIKSELLSMSSATVDRYLKRYKAQFARSKRSGIKPGKMFKNIIPVKSFNLSIDRPGFVEADTVAHCGGSLSGTFAWTLTFTDVYTGWTDNRAIWGKGAEATLSAICCVQAKLPYELLSFNSDNGTEFLNRSLYNHFCSDENKVIEFTRSRAYRKNDNCHVEQKNWTHVRETFGYDRFEKEMMIDLMNEIYRNY